jgi:hypothetical protein
VCDKALSGGKWKSHSEYILDGKHYCMVSCCIIAVVFKALFIMIVGKKVGFPIFM